MYLSNYIFVIQSNSFRTLQAGHSPWPQIAEYLLDEDRSCAARRLRLGALAARTSSLLVYILTLLGKFWEVSVSQVCQISPDVTNFIQFQWKGCSRLCPRRFLQINVHFSACFMFCNIFAMLHNFFVGIFWMSVHVFHLGFQFFQCSTLKIPTMAFYSSPLLSIARHGSL